MDKELELLIEVDFLIREQSLLLSQFEGLKIDSTCGGHIRTEEWVPHRDREGSYLVLYYFIPGLDRVINRKDRKNNPENDIVINYEYFGQEINREVFGNGVHESADEFMFLPFDDIQGHLRNPKIQQLYFDCPHLYFKELRENSNSIETNSCYVEILQHSRHLLPIEKQQETNINWNISNSHSNLT
ncbi:MAG: hypothetical protein KAK00_06745 [Nanoarchaeota archaeon]|nr:hypothetical protein [Nanoarchaeota archaeon]